MLRIDTATVSKVLLADGWHAVEPGSFRIEQLAYKTVAAQAGAQQSFVFYEGGEVIVGPIASLLAVRASGLIDE